MGVVRNSYLLILAATPFLFSRSLNRVFEGGKIVFLMLAGGALCVMAGAAIYRNRDSLDWVWERVAHPVCLWMALFFASYAAACAYSIAPQLSLIGAYERQMGLITATLFILLFGVAVLFFRVQDVPKILLATALPGVLVALHACLQSWGIFPLGFESAYQVFFSRAFATLGHPVYLGLYFCLVIPLSVALVLSDARKPLSWFLAGGWTLMIYALAKTFSRGALVGVSVSFFFFAIIYLRNFSGALGKYFSGKLRGTLAVLLVMTVMGSVLFQAFPGLKDRLVTIFYFEDTHRYHLFKGAWEIIQESPLLGTGPETFRIAFLPHKSLTLTLYYPLANHDRAHNQYLHVWATQGLFGLIAYLGLLISLCLAAWDTVKNQTASREARLMGLGIFCALIGYAVGLLPGFDNLTTLLLFHTLAATAVILQQGQTPMFRSPVRPSSPLSLFIRGKTFVSQGGLAVLGTSGILFILFGASIWLADRQFVLAKGETLPEKRIARLEKASAWAPLETYYDFYLSRKLFELSYQKKDPNEKRELLLRAVGILEKSLGYSWLPESYVQQLSSILVKLGRYQRAESIIRKFLLFDPTNIFLESNLILALGHQNKFDEILELTDQWKRRYSLDGGQYWYAGLAYESMGEYKKAEREFIHAVVRTPSRKDFEGDLKRVRAKLRANEGAGKEPRRKPPIKPTAKKRGRPSPGGL